MAKNNFNNYKLKGIIFIILAFFCGGAAGTGIDFALRPTENGNWTIDASFSMELSNEQIPAEIETDEGAIETIDAPTVEEVSSNQLVDECPEGEEDCGKGRYIYAPTETFTEFKDYTLGGCWDVDNYPQGAKVQCWDLAALFWMNYRLVELAQLKELGIVKNKTLVTNLSLFTMRLNYKPETGLYLDQDNMAM